MSGRRRKERADSPATLARIATRFSASYQWWRAEPGAQANGLPTIEITSPRGIPYRAGQRGGNRDPLRVSVWPANVDYEATPYDFVTPEASFAAERGEKGLFDALTRLGKKWHPLLEAMIAQQKVNARHAAKRADSMQRMTDSMGERVNTLMNDITSGVAPRVTLRARVHGGSVDLTAYGLPAELAAEVAEFIRARIGDGK